MKKIFEELMGAWELARWEEKVSLVVHVVCVTGGIIIGWLSVAALLKYLGS